MLHCLVLGKGKQYHQIVSAYTLLQYIYALIDSLPVLITINSTVSTGCKAYASTALEAYYIVCA